MRKYTLISKGKSKGSKKENQWKQWMPNINITNNQNHYFKYYIGIYFNGFFMQTLLTDDMVWRFYDTTSSEDIETTIEHVCNPWGYHWCHLISWQFSEFWRRRVFPRPFPPHCRFPWAPGHLVRLSSASSCGAGDIWGAEAGMFWSAEPPSAGAPRGLLLKIKYYYFTNPRPPPHLCTPSRSW